MARVMRAIAGGLGVLRDVHLLAMDRRCAVQNSSQPTPRYQLHHNPYDHDVFAQQRLAELVAQLEPDSVLLYHDPWHVPRLQRTVRSSRVATRVMAYCPLDGELLRPGIAQALAGLDRLCVPTQFAARTLGPHLPEPPEVIPHGLDLADFRPVNGALEQFRQRRWRARRQLFPNQPELWDGFWVLNANRNHGRKQLDLTLQGFAEFTANMPVNVRLYLPWGRERFGPNIPLMARSLGIAERVICPDPMGGSTEDLNLAYNAADVGVNTSTGEGWGLIGFEHAATGAAQVVPEHSACGELWRHVGLLLPTERRLSLAGVLAGGRIDSRALAQILSQLYRNPDECQEWALRAYRYSQLPQWQWPRIARQWQRALLEMEHRVRPALQVNG